MTDLAIKARVDASGKSCPMPIVMTKQAMNGLTSGELLEVIATDPGSVKDFAAWSTATGNQLVEQEAGGGTFRFVLRHK